VRSARASSRLIIAGLSLAGLAGCVTTQQEAAWVQINSARLRASQAPLDLAGRSTQVEVTSVRLIALPRAPESAIVVTLRNRASRPVSDLPVLVGVSLPHGRHISLNRETADYFQNHVPAIGPHAALSFVLTVARRLPAGAVPFARVGRSATVAVPVGAELPAVEVTSSRERPGGATLTVRNLSGIPQFQLPVYAVARRHGESVAAGQTLVSELDSGASAQLRVSLIGNSAGATLSLQAPPTILK
jgi:hypothetical protein